MLILKDMKRDCLEETGGKKRGVVHTSRVFAYEWQGKDLRDRECVGEAGKGLTGGRFCVFAHDEESDPSLVTCDP